MDEKVMEPKAIVAVDPSEHSKRAVILSGRFGKATGVKLTLLHVIEDPKSYRELPDTWSYKQKIKEAQELLDRFKKIAEESGAIDVHTMIAVGPVSEEIVRIAEEGEFDYLVLGTRGMGAVKRFLLGSVADKVVHHAHLPVVVTRVIEKGKRVPLGKKGEKMKLLVAIDDSKASEKAVFGTSQFAGRADVHMTLLYVLEDVIHYDEIPDTYVYSLRKERAIKVLERAKRIAEAVDIKDIDTKIAVGPIVEEIIREAEAYVSIVLGWKDGNIFGKLLSIAPRPIVIIR